MDLLFEFVLHVECMVLELLVMGEQTFGKGTTNEMEFSCFFFFFCICGEIKEFLFRKQF